MKMDLPKFYIGQKVVCVSQNNTGKPVLNKTYIVRDVSKTDCCNYWIVRVNEPQNLIALARPVCSNCGIQYQDHAKYNGFYLESRFRPLEQQSFPLITLSKIQEKEEALCSN